MALLTVDKEGRLEVSQNLYLPARYDISFDLPSGNIIAKLTLDQDEMERHIVDCLHVLGMDDLADEFPNANAEARAERAAK